MLLFITAQKTNQTEMLCQWPLCFIYSLIVLSCLSDMADKKIKIENSSPNKSYENELVKVVKSIMRQAMDA